MKPRILFLGGTQRGLMLLKSLVANQENIVFCCIQQEDDHETIILSDQIEALCQANQIPMILCKRISKDNIDKISSLKPDVAFVCSWRTLIPVELIRGIPSGCLGAHDSLLPQYRGFAPTAWAIINGEKETGVTLF